MTGTFDEKDEEHIPYIQDSTRQTSSVVARVDNSRGASMLMRSRQLPALKQTLTGVQPIMASKSLYLRYPSTDPDYTWEMRKFDMDFEPKETYFMVESAYGEWACSCPAHVVECRHVKMLDIFDRAEKGEFDKYTRMRNFSHENSHVVFLQYDGKMYDWILGPLQEEA